MQTITRFSDERPQLGRHLIDASTVNSRGGLGLPLDASTVNSVLYVRELTLQLKLLPACRWSRERTVTLWNGHGTTCSHSQSQAIFGRPRG